jgi:hypothetical protein
MLRHIGLMFTTALTLIVVSQTKAATVDEILSELEPAIARGTRKTSS